MAKQKPTSSQLQNVESTLTKAEQFIEDNQKLVIIAATVIIGLVAIYLGFRRFYLKPLADEAESQIFVAEQYFEKDSFRLALDGDGNNLGFNDIISEYGLTPSGNLAKYYAGICNLRLGNYEDAISTLNKFHAKDKLVGAISLGDIGNAYMQLGEVDKAITYYLKAADYNKNSMTTPIYLIKAGYAYESVKEYQKALDVYKRVKKDFSTSNESRNIDKYIARVEVLLNQ